MDLILIYLLLINTITFFVYGLDKWKAIKGKRRISERMLLVLATVGGTIGAGVGMGLFHHKIRKPKFYLGVPTLFALQLAAFVYFYYYF